MTTKSPSASQEAKWFEGLVREDQLWLVPAFLAYLRNGERPLRADSVRFYARGVLSFLRLAGADGRMTIEDLATKAKVIVALTQLPSEKVSQRRALVFGVKALGRFLNVVELIGDDRAEALSSLRLKAKAKPKRLHLEPEEVERLLRALLTVGAYEVSERVLNVALVGFLAVTGLRSSEACLLSLEDVCFERGLVHVASGKGGRSRTIGLPRRLEPLLRTYLRHRPETQCQRFFVGPGGKPLDRQLLVRRMARISTLAGTKVTCHSLRRSFATMTAHRNVPLDKLQVVLGHADLSTTRSYVITQAPAVALEMRDW